MLTAMERQTPNVRAIYDGQTWTSVSWAGRPPCVLSLPPFGITTPSQFDVVTPHRLPRRLRPINALLKQGATFDFIPALEATIRAILHELTEPPILVYPDWDAVADDSRPFRLYCDASMDGFGATLEQEQPDGSVRPITDISRATLDSERSWTPLDLEAGSIVWAIKRLRGHLWSTRFEIYSDHKALENIAKVGEHNARVRRWLESLSAYNYTLNTAKVRPTATPTSFHAYHNQPPTPTAPDATASLVPTLLASTSSAPAASHRTSRLHRESAWVGSCSPLQDPFQQSSLFPSPPTTIPTSAYWDHAWSTTASPTTSSGLFQPATPPPGRSSAPTMPP